jgi:hypothetical protein
MTEVARAQAKARADSKKLASEMISDADAAEKAKLEFIKRANAQKIAELAKSNKTEVELAKDAAAVTAKAEAEKTAAAQKTAKEQIKAAQEKSKAAKRYLEEEKTQQEAANAAQVTAIKGYLSMGAAMMGLSSGRAVVSAVVGELDRTVASAQKAAEQLFTIRGAVRELAALRGEMGKTGPTAAHVLGMQAKTLQSTDEVNQMEQAAIGIGDLAIGKTISKADFDKSLESAGKMATLEGGSADAYGALTGQIALQSDHILSPEEHQARLNRLFLIQQPGGFKNMSQAAGQFSQLNGLVMNKILTAEEGMGLVSAFSTSGQAASSGTDAEHFIRATLASRLKGRGMSVSPELDFEKSYEYMKSIGADKMTNPVTIGNAISADFKAQAAKDPNFKSYDYLTLHGFGNEQDKQAIMAYAGLKNTGMIDKIETAQKSGLDMGKPGEGPIDRLFNDRVRNDPFFQRRQAETLDQLGSAKQGARAEPYDIARLAAFAKLKDAGRITGDYSSWPQRSEAQDFAEDIAAFRDPASDSYGAIRTATSRSLKAEARRLGIPDEPVSMFSQETNDRDLARKIQARGGDLTGLTASHLAAAAKDLRDAVRELKNTVTPKGPPAAIPGKPVPPRMRP